MGTRRRDERHLQQRRRVIAAALAVADRRGVEGVSMRAVALELGVATMSLYRYVRSKDELLDAMFEHLLGEITSSGESKTWRGGLVAMARRARTILCEHPRWVPLLSRVATPTSVFAELEHFFARLAQRAPAWEVASLSVSAVIAYTLGFVLVQQLMLDGDGSPVPSKQLRLVRERLSGEDARAAFPALASTTDALPPFSFDDIYELGLRALVRGLSTNASKIGGQRRAAAPARHDR